MRLCVHCGQIETHGAECPQAPAIAKTPEEKNARALASMESAEAALAEVDPLVGSAPDQAILRLASLEALLERFPAGHLQAYADKRSHNELVTTLAQTRASAVDRLPADGGAQLVADWGFAKRSLELLFAVAARRADVAQLDMTELGKLPAVPIKSAMDPATPLSKVNAELEQRIQEERELDNRVSAWGWKNLRRLMTEKEPAEVPPSMIGGGVAGALGALVGRGPQTRRLSAVSQFMLLGGRMRERLYVLGAHGILLGALSRASQAEDLWARHLAKDDGAARWSRLKTGTREVLEYFLGGQLPDDVEAHVTELATSSPARRHVSLRPFNELDGDEWDGLAKAYFFLFASIMAGGSSRDIGMETLARAVLERSRGKPADANTRALALQEVRDAWHVRPPQELTPPEKR